MNVLLITVQDIINSSVIEDNVDVKLLAKTISIAQEVSLKPILGYPIYEYIISGVTNYLITGGTMDTLTSEIVAASKPYLIARVVADFILINNYKVSNKGVIKLNDTSATALTNIDIESIQDYYNNLVSIYKEDLVKYLKSVNLINYRNDIEITEDSTGWYLGSNRARHWKRGIDESEDININQEETTDAISQYVAPANDVYNYKQLSALNNVLLISTQDIFEQTNIEDNVDKRLLSTTIQQVQNIHLKAILYDNIYNDLLNSVFLNSLSGTSIDLFYQDLLTLVKPYLINRTVADFIIPNNYKFSNKGLIKLNDTSATALTNADIESIQDYYNNLSTTYKNSIIEFLRKYNLLDGRNDSDITADATGWFFGTTKPDRRNNIDLLTTPIDEGFTTSSVFITGGTFSNDTLYLTNSTGNTLSILLTGITSDEIFITGGTYSNGTLVINNNTGGTVSINGFYTGGTFIDTYSTGGTYSNGTLNIKNNLGGSYSINGFYTGGTFIDTYSTGGTYSNGTLNIKNNTGGTISINGFYTGGTGSIATSGTTLYSTNPVTTGFNTIQGMFFGTGAGSSATGASYSNFLGYNAGGGATNATTSNFFGQNAGTAATGASSSNFFGQSAGNGATNASSSNFFGYDAGASAINASSSNFFGSSAGYNATNASASNFFGSNAGNGATSASNSNFFGSNAGNGATGSSNSNFFGQYAGLSVTNAPYSNFFGNNAGTRATNASYSNFFGYYAGNGATNASYSNFYGQNAGNVATGASYSNFYGQNAGNGAINASNSNFYGSTAGNGATNASYSNFFGYYAGNGATNASNSNFYGQNAGNGAINASYSNFFGYKAGYNAGSGSTGSNNLIFGTNISLSSGATNSMNFGGVLFGTGFYSATTGNPSILANGGSIGINQPTPDNSAYFDIVGTTKGALLPRMTTSQKNAIPTPAEGLEVYDLTLHKKCVFTGSVWETITSS